MSEHLLERGKAIRWAKGNRGGVTKIDEGSSRKEKGRWEKGQHFCRFVQTRMISVCVPHLK